MFAFERCEEHTAARFARGLQYALHFLDVADVEHGQLEIDVTEVTDAIGQLLETSQAHSFLGADAHATVETAPRLRFGAVEFVQ